MSPLAKLLTSCLPKFRWLPDDLPDDYFPPPRDLYFPKHKRGDIIPYKNTLPRATLSLNTLPDTNILERTDNQASSFLFSKLPLELRLKIYEYIYEPKIVHISVSQSGHAGHFACEDDNSVGFSKEMKRCMCSTAVSYGARVPIAYPGSAKYAHSIGSFDLLLTCRRVYTEAIPYLYRPHTFHLLHCTHLLYIGTYLPLPRLNTIRKLSLHWQIRGLPLFCRNQSLDPQFQTRPKFTYPDDTAMYLKAWSVLAKMEGLKELHVVLLDQRRTWRRHWGGVQEDLLAPAKLVVGPDVFTLRLPYEDCETDCDMGASACVLLAKEDWFGA